MTGISGNVSNMFRWLKKKSKHDKAKPKAEDDYGFRKKQIIVEETENGHAVIIKDDETTIVYPQSFCKFHYRARMPTPVQNFRETSSHIYDEIPEHCIATKTESGMEKVHENEADLIKDTRTAEEKEQCSSMDFQNAIEVGPYLIVPLVNAQNGDVEILKKRKEELQNSDTAAEVGPGANFNSINLNSVPESDSSTRPWLKPSLSGGLPKDTKVVLTRCVKTTRPELKDTSNNPHDCHSSVLNNGSDLCSFKKGAQNMQCAFRIFTDSPGADSNSRTLTGSPDSSSRTPDISSERSESCAIPNDDVDEKVDEATSVIAKPESKSKRPSSAERPKSAKKETNVSQTVVDGNDTCYEFDLSTSGDSEQSRTSEQADYELYLSKIESNLVLKHNVRKLMQDSDSDDAKSESEKAESNERLETESMTYVSTLSECSSVTSHVSHLSADKSESDDSSGYYECLEESRDPKSKPRDACQVNLERSLSMPESSLVAMKTKYTSSSKRHSKTKTGSKSSAHRSKSFDKEFKDIYKALSDEDKELYKFPSSSNSGSSVTSRHGRGKAVLAPQPTPVYMDPYRGKSGRHNRLLGDLIRMNYDKQLLFH